MYGWPMADMVAPLTQPHDLMTYLWSSHWWTIVCYHFIILCFVLLNNFPSIFLPFSLSLSLLLFVHSHSVAKCFDRSNYFIKCILCSWNVYCACHIFLCINHLLVKQQSSDKSCWYHLQTYLQTKCTMIVVFNC